MSIKCFKLVNQEDVLAEVTNETPTFVQLKNPVVMAMVREGQLGIIPWLPLAEKFECTIETKHIIISYVPKQDLINHYKEVTGKIVVAGAGVLNQLPKTPPNFGR